MAMAFAEDIVVVVVLLDLGGATIGFFENIPIIGSLGTENDTAHACAFCIETIFDHILFASLNTEMFVILHGYENTAFAVMFCSVEKLNAASFL